MLTATSIYEELGVTPVINARGHNTVLGGSTPSPGVKAAMERAERYYVDMAQLLDRSGQIVADLLGAEAAAVHQHQGQGLVAVLPQGPGHDRVGREGRRLLGQVEPLDRDAPPPEPVQVGGDAGQHRIHRRAADARRAAHRRVVDAELRHRRPPDRRSSNDDEMGQKETPAYRPATSSWSRASVPGSMQ